MKICPVCRHCYEDAETACARGHGILHATTKSSIHSRGVLDKSGVYARTV